MSVWGDLKKTPISFNDLMTPSPDNPIITKANNSVPAGSIAFDLETGSVDDMWITGPAFVRLGGIGLDDHEISLTTDFYNLVKEIHANDGWIISHNGLNFDLILLAKHFNLDLLKIAKQDRIIDTKLVAFLNDPPASRTKEGEIERMFSLDNTGLRYLGEGKVKDIQSGKSVLKELAKQFGGFDQIPVDHPQYREYLRQDVIVTRDLAKVLPMNDYAIREHKINAIAATISIQGFRVDVDLLEQRIQEGEEKKDRILHYLMEYGLPGPETSKAPHRTKAGITAIDNAFSNLGVFLPRTEKTGRPALGKEVLQGVIEASEMEEVIDLAEAVLSLNGIRCVPLNSEILTRDGWKAYDKVQIGDETLGLDKDDKMHWTKITHINLYDEAPLISMSNNHFGVICTPNHRWVSDHRYNSSDWTKENPGTSKRIREMREASNLGAYDRIIVSAKANIEHSLPISIDEAEIIGWFLGDGYCKWNPHNQNKSEYIVFNITQSKPDGVEALRDLTRRSRLTWSERFCPSRNNSFVFTLKSSDARELWKRCGFSINHNKNEIDLMSFVLALGSEERSAFIQGFWGAEGHLVDGKNRVVSQMPGNVAEAIRLAVFLDGHRASRPNKSADGCDKIRCDAPPSITGERLTKTEIPSAPVWCPTTELGTWVMRQGDQICLTGNSIYGNIQEHLVGDKVHPSINLRQSSGRWSIQKPGLTVVGKREGKVIERAVFLADSYDHVLISCDLSQVDARAVAGLSQDVQYLKLFEPGKDFHAEIAERIFGDRNKRELAKPVTHGWSYGMQPHKLSKTTNLTLEEAEEFDAEMTKRFPTLVDWQHNVREEGSLNGVLFNGFGRKLRIEPERSFTQSPALLGQSTARDILCEGVLRLWDFGGDDVIKMIRGVIHDELILSVPKKDVEEIEQLVKKSLSFEWCPKNGTYPIFIDAGLNLRGKNWSQAYCKPCGKAGRKECTCQ